MHCVLLKEEKTIAIQDGKEVSTVLGRSLSRQCRLNRTDAPITGMKTDIEQSVIPVMAGIDGHKEHGKLDFTHEGLL